MSVKVYSKVNSGAVSAGGTAITLTPLIIWAAEQAGYDMPTMVAGTIGGLIGMAASYIGGYLKKETRQPHRPT